VEREHRPGPGSEEGAPPVSAAAEEAVGSAAEEPATPDAGTPADVAANPDVTASTEETAR
jgi:hypothetical protein